MPSLLAFLLLAIYLLKTSVARSSSPSDVSGAPSDATAENPSVTKGEGKPEILNVTVPRLLREIYFNLSQPNRTQADLLYEKANSIRSFENQARTNDPCQPMRFKLPVHSEGAVYLNSEVHLYHQVPSKQLRKLSHAAKTRQYRVDICISFGEMCLTVPQAVQISPVYVGWVTLRFPPRILIKAKLTHVELKINIYSEDSKIDCSSWPLTFVLNNSSGQDRAPLYMVYASQPRDSIVQDLFKKAFKRGSLKHPQSRRRKKSSMPRRFSQMSAPATPIPTSSATMAPTTPALVALMAPSTPLTPTPSIAPSVPPTAPSTPTAPPPSPLSCRKKDLYIGFGVNFTLPNGLASLRPFNIGYCGGYCNDLFAVKHTSRTGILNLAKRKGVIGIHQYPEHCVPASYRNLTVLLINGRGDYVLLTISDLVVESCMCTV